MTGETKHVYTINNKEPSSKDSHRDTAFEHFNKNDAVDNSMSRVSESSDSAFSSVADKGPEKNSREKEPHSQREAVIRPQQAGKIDFKSLQNRSKFHSDASWSNGKSSPVSPTGRSRGKDKSKRSGKGDRTQHQLYRLSITNTRPNPTIGIAYPQQKVTQPKNVEVNRGPVSGSYRFHVPSLPEREAELQQEDLNFNRCFQESSPSLTSTNYTSQNTPASRTHHGIKLQLQPSNTHEAPTSNGELHYLEFQPNGNSWNSSEKNFNGSSNYSIGTQKLCPYPEGNKSDSHCFGSMPFQYPFQPLQESNGNSFCSNTSSQDFVDVSNQVAHGTFPFQSSSREGPENPQGNGSYSNGLPDTRTYSLSSQQAPFLHVQQGVQHPPTPQCYTVRNEHPPDHNGAISSSGAVSSSGAIDQSPSTFQENKPVFITSEFSLHSNSVPSLVNKRQQSVKDFAPSQRLLTPGNTLRRNIPQSSLNQVHFPGKVYNGVNTGSVPFDKSISRIPQTWDAGSKTFPPLDQSSVSYSNSSGTLLPYQCQPNVEQRPALKNANMPWQQVHLPTAMPNQNRIELPRQIGNQKLPYHHGNSEWPNNNNLLQKIPPSYHAKKHLTVESISAQRIETSRPSYSSTSGIFYDGVKEGNSQVCDSRNKGILYGMNQPMQQTTSSRNNSNQSMSCSPSESPLPSPATNPVSGSSCSSLSPLSSSPLNHSSDDSQVQQTLTSSPYFHQPCHPAETLNSGSLIYPNPDSSKNFNYLSEASKEDQLYQKQSTEPGKGCLDSFENEPPPPYSSHHLLANSLSSANLDQLDVLLTCKQCDQNYNNLPSFLEHRQYCSLNSSVHTEMKDSLRSGEVRKQAVEPNKISGLSLPKGHLEVSPHLIGFNKVVDFLLDGDVKADPKDDAMKSNIFHNLISSSLPLTVCDTLEMDDAKLDSLITEALNGLEFQVDNPEIDSSFIDVFADDELSTAKSTGSGLPYKFKDSVEIKKKQSGVDENQLRHNMFPNVFEENYDTDPSLNHRNLTKRQSETKKAEIGTVHKYSLDAENNNIKDVTPKIPDDCELQKKTESGKCVELDKQQKESSDILKLSKDKDQKMSHGRKSSKRDPQECPVTENQKPRRCSMKDVKKKKSHNGTWSKELIHKIVQQKNKLHKLHVKSNKHVQFSLVTERLFPPAKSHTFGEYDYISDSDDEADLAVKKQMANGRLKYNFNRDHQGRAGRMKEKETVWRMGEATRFQLHNKDLRSNNKETFNRVRRRSSQSSTSSDQSTSISSETGSSPKSIEHTDSENEQETMLRRKNVNSSNQNIAVERNFVRPLYKESLLETFSKGPKRFGSAKFLLAGSKVFPSKVNDSKYIGDNEKSQQSQEMDDKEDNSRKSTEGLLLYEDEHESTCHKEGIVINISQENYTNDLLLDVDNVPIPFSSLHEDTIHFQTKKANVSTCIPAEHNTEVTLNYTDAGLKFIKEGICNDHETFSMPVGCYSGDSTENEKNHEAYNSESQQFPEHEDLPDLYGNNLFPKAQHVAPSEIGQLYLNQSNPSSTNNGSFEHKCSQLPTYSTDNNEHKVSSTLSFDSSSIFSELPMSDFEAPLFNSIQPTKDTYVGYTCSNEQSRKPTHYEQQYPQFLQQKNWGLNEGPSLMANTIIAPFPVVENQSTEKYIEQMPASSGPMALALSDSLGDYNASFINISEDELEIKRLVTELENQLQTNNMHNNVSSQACPKNQTNADLSSTTVPFPDTTENAVESYSKNLYLEDFSSLSNPTHVEQNLQGCQALAKVEDNCGSLKNPWTCSVQFDSFPSSIQCHNQSSSLESFNHTDTDSQYPETLNDVTVTEKLDSLSSNHRSPSVLPDACLHDIDTQSTCQAFSASTLIRDTLVTAETLLSGKEENEMVIENDTQQNEPDNLFLKKEQLEERFDDPPELEPFQSVSELNSEFSAHDCDVPVLNRTSPPLKNEKSPGGVLSDPGFRDEIPSSAVVEEYNLNCQKVSEKEGPVDISSCRDQQKKDKRKPAPLDMPVLEKEESAITEKSSTNKDSTENPLQQLQLFVARTAKNNEEEMLMPCFPVLLATSSHVSPQADIECDSSSTPDSKLTSKAAKSSDIIEIEDVPDLAETSMLSANIKQMHPLANEKTSASSESLSNEAQNEVTQSHFTENECSRLDVINIDHRETAHDSDPLPQSNDTENLVREQAKMDDKMKALMKTDRNKAALTMDINQQSTYAFDDQAFAVFPQNTPTVPCMGITSPHKSNTGYQLLCGLTLEVIDNQVSQEKNIDASVFTSPGNQKDVINNILQEKELIMTNGEICKEASPVRQDKSDASVFPDEISGQFPLHFNQQKSLHKRNIDYQTQLPEMSSPNPHSPLDFDLFAHLPLKTSISKSDGYCQSSENIMCPAEEEPTPSSPNCPIKVSNCKDQSEKHSLVGPDVLLYLGEDRCLTSSLDMGRKPLTKNEGPVSPSAKGNICFCNELVCPHYKQPETCSAADAILQCGSLPLSNGYPIFAETECQKYSTLSNELFTDHIQTVADPPLCCQKDDGLKWDSQKGAHISHAFPNENHSAALVCDLINITESSYVDLSNPQISLAADGRIAQASTICISAETHSSVADTERKCPNDMDSVIDGVLRILDCDKSKEILESIGIPSRNSPLKEKKSIEQSLICDICSMSFRSKPGLSRHKAAKHNMKNDGTMIAHKDGASENGKNKDNSSGNIEHDVLQNFISDSVSQKPTTELLGQESNIQIQYLISEEQQRPISTKSKEESNGPSDDTSGVEVTGRKRLIGRIKKRKIKTLSNKTTDSQVPSDDILNILKTNILKAIGQSNGFTSVEEKTTWTQPADTDKAQEGTKAIVLETYSAKQHYVEEENVKGNILDIGINKELLAGELKWAKDLKSQIENPATNICDTEHATRLSTNAETSVIEKTLLYPPNNCVEGHSTVPESRLGQKDLPVSIVPKHVEPDLHSLFDDDKNFSQLFPRDDHFIRRKCTRVYGKKTKRQSPPFKTDFKNIDLVEPNSLTQAKNNTYEYGNILVDENLVGNKGSLGHTEPDSEFRSISPVKERISIDDSGLLPFLPQSQAIENLTGRSLSEESQDGKDLDISFEDALFKSPEVSHSSFTERSSRMQDSELEEVFDCKMGEETSLPEFPTIDMKMLSAKFDMRELSFFSACGDDSDQSDADRPDTTRKTEKHKRNGRNKMEDKRQSRTRGNVNIKTKEKQYKCKVCFQWFLTLGELDFHKLTHNPSPPPTCYMCVQRKFSSREQLRDHLKDKHAKNKAGLWICGMCLKEISDVWMYNEHLREHATQFARKGQAQKTVMGIPGCFAEDNLVRTFLSTFIYRTPAKSSKTSEPEDKSPSGKKQDHKDHKDEEEHVTEKEPEGSTSNASNTSVHVKVSVSPLLETIQKTESVQKNPAIHPHCKDPSRDCHHCGKQFPKPFKLQRHLVVHSLQKIYLCHKCPKSYQEVHELRNHLNSEHQLSEETEIKHTTLYACELCADVMHVIKKSFICSTCNYTFSKKEQYDRHMEKHLIGGSMTFKFRGVMRPCFAGKEVKDKIKEPSSYEGMPPSKKQKTYNYSETPPDITCADIKNNKNQSPSVQHVLSPAVILDKEVKDIAETKEDIAVKTEDMAGDVSCSILPLHTKVGNPIEEVSNVADNEEINVSQTEITLSTLPTTANNDLIIQDTESTQEPQPPVLYLTNPVYMDTAQKSPLQNQEKDLAEVSDMGSPLVMADDLLCHLLSREPAELFASNNEMSTNMVSNEDMHCPQTESVVVEKEDALKSQTLNGAVVTPMLSKVKSITSDGSGSVKDLKGPKKNKGGGQINKSVSGGEGVSKSSAPKLKPVTESYSVSKDSSVCTLKETVGAHHKVSKKEPIVYLPKHNSVDSVKMDDKASTALTNKVHPKKRKEHKISGHKGGSASRENMAGEVKKKKSIVGGSGKSDTSGGGVKKPDYTSTVSAFSEIKDETLCSRLTPKPHTGISNGQLKKMVLDTHNQKKATSRSSNGEYKCKKIFQNKTLQPFSPKSSALSLISSQKRKQGHSMKPTEPSNYRTAESQNNLLSQLFGQKLTSFKIPLRRDITE